MQPKQAQEIDAGGEQLFECANNEKPFLLQLNETEQTNQVLRWYSSPAAATDGQTSSGI